MENNIIKFEMDVPSEYIGDDGEILPEFYEPLFNMIGKRLGDSGPVVEAIIVSEAQR